MTKRTIVKQSRPIYKASLIPATDIWPHRDECQGKFVLLGTNEQNVDLRTSMIVSINGNAVETCNSIYVVDRLTGLGNWKEDSGYVK